jgi:hypothetical protein
LPATKILATTKYSQWLNIDGHKISMATKYPRRQNINGNKILMAPSIFFCCR